MIWNKVVAFPKIQKNIIGIMFFKSYFRMGLFGATRSSEIIFESSQNSIYQSIIKFLKGFERILLKIVSEL